MFSWTQPYLVFGNLFLLRGLHDFFLFFFLCYHLSLKTELSESFLYALLYGCHFHWHFFWIKNILYALFDLWCANLGLKVPVVH